MIRLIVLLLIVLLSNVEFVLARPQYAMLSGKKCINCHSFSQGSALRNEYGFNSKLESNVFNLKETFVADIVDGIGNYNNYFNESIRIGFDYRLLSARIGGPENSKRETFPMQVSPYIFIKPIKDLAIFGHYNFSPVIYPGQSRWSGFLLYQPDSSNFEAKIGMIKPSIGNQYDDHTLFVRQIAGASRAFPILPPDYAEWGAEISYEINNLVNITAGAYKANNFSQNFVVNDYGRKYPLVNFNSLSGLLRIATMPQFWNKKINTNIGGSLYFNEGFQIVNGFIHFGLTNYVSLLSEYVYTYKHNNRISNNYFVELLYHVSKPFDLSVRYERANTEYIHANSSDFFHTNQYVFGTNIYLLPFVELRPEYRIYDRGFAESYARQWAFQLHVYL